MTSPARTVAVIDDDASIRAALGQLLRLASFQGLTFGSAEEYLASDQRSVVACLVVDVNLPGMSGVALVQTLRAAGTLTPVVFISAREDRQTLSLVRMITGAPFLRKPFSDVDLLSAIGRAIDD